MVLTDEIRSIRDMERMAYSPFGVRYVKPEDLQTLEIAKTTGTVTTSITGVYQAVLGAQAWVQLNMEANTFGVLPKVPWGRSGWRVITARAQTIPSAGVAEDGSLPSAIYPTIATVSTKPKTAAQVFEITEVHDTLTREGYDDNYWSMADARIYNMVEHKEDINTMLMEDFDTLASNAFESIDRVTATASEQAGVGATAGDDDIYGIDRGANSWADAYSNHASGTDRFLTDSLLQTTWRNIRTNGGNPTFWLTGWDTLASWNQLFDPQVRYAIMGSTLVQPSVNGIETVEGIGVGTKVATYHGLPIILSKDTPQDTISRIYLLDTSNPEGYDIPRLSIKVLRPTTYHEAGVGVGRPLEISKLNLRGMYSTIGELICTFFKAQGKLRDLK